MSHKSREKNRKQKERAKSGNQNPGDRQTESDQAGTEMNRAEEPQIHGSRDKETSRQESERSRDKASLRVQWATFWVLTLTLFVLVIYTGATLYMANQSAISTLAATKAARAATSSNQIASESLRLDQRAWISISRLDTLPPLLEVGKTVVIQATIRNTGRTPARHIVSTCLFETLSGKEVPNFNYREEDSQRFGTIAPNGDYSFSIDNIVMNRSTNLRAALTPPLLGLLEAGKLRLFVHGKITYDDIFDQHHWMTFCFYWTSGKRPPFTPYSEHNDTDG